MANGPAPTAAGRAGAPGAGEAAAPRVANINHACMSMDGFEPDKVLKALTDFGLKRRGSGPTGPLMHYVTLRAGSRRRAGGHAGTLLHRS
jgi:hypothetical protein